MFAPNNNMRVDHEDFLRLLHIVISNQVVFYYGFFFPYNQISRHMLYFGVGIEALLFSVALGDRINIIRKEEAAVKAKLLNLTKKTGVLITGLQSKKIKTNTQTYSTRSFLTYKRSKNCNF